MGDYLLDSNILILYLRNRPEAVALCDTLARQGILACSVVTVLEVQAGARPHEETKTNALLRSLRAYDVTYAIANLAGKYIRTYRAQGITLDFADSLIAATAVIHGLTLVTTNTKHFPMAEIRLYTPVA